MPENKVIVNTSPLLYLHQVDQLQLLQKLYGIIITPIAVTKEGQSLIMFRSPEVGSPCFPSAGEV